MRDRILALGLMALLGAGCESADTAGQAELDGPNSLAVAGRTLFVAGTSRAQLRALDLESGRFHRAPNPLFALAIPTAAQPRSLASWSSADGAASAPFVLALSSAQASVSVVSAAELKLVATTEKQAIDLPGVPLSLAMTPPAGDGSVRGVVAVAPAAEEPALYTVTLPAGLAADPSLLSAVVPERRAPLGEAIPRVLAASPANANLVAVGDRISRTDALMLVDLTSGVVERFEVGGPVSALAFDPSGSRLYGLLDSESCAAAGTVCAGLFGFSVSERRLLDGSPLEIPGVPRGLAAGRQASLKVGDGTVEVAELVVVSSANGFAYLVDGAAMRVVDADADGPTVSTDTDDTYHLEPDGSKSEAPAPGPQDVVLAEGAARSESISVTFAGTLPFLSQRRGTASAGALSGDGPDFVALGVAVGDRVEFADAASCPAATVAAVEAGKLTLTGMGAACLGSVVYTVRAADGYVVSGSVSGLLGRVRSGEAFVWQGSYYHRPEGFDPAAPALRFTMGPGDPRPGAGYVLGVDSGVSPFYGSNGAAFSLPGAVVQDPLTNFFYVSYEGGNAVVQLKPNELESGSTDSGWAYFR